MRVDIHRKATLAGEIVPGVLEAGDEEGRIDLQPAGERRAEGFGLAEPVAAAPVGGEEGGVAPDRLAVAPPVAAERPARQRLPRVPLALAVMEERARRPAPLEAPQQRPGE